MCANFINKKETEHISLVGIGLFDCEYQFNTIILIYLVALLIFLDARSIVGFR